MTTRGITVLVGGLKETQEITRLAEAAGFDAAWSGEFLHRGHRVAGVDLGAGREQLHRQQVPRGCDVDDQRVA